MFLCARSFSLSLCRILSFYITTWKEAYWSFQALIILSSNWIYYIDFGNIGNIRLDRENQIDRLTVRSIIFEMEDTLEDLTYPVVDSTKQRSQSKLTLPSPHSKRLVERYDTSRGRGCVCTHVGACSQRTHARRGLLDRSHADKNCIMGLIGLRGPA